MAIPILGGVYLGKFLDDKLNTGFIFLAIFSVLGIITSFISLFKITTKGTKGK
ncbi:AtpZ/AtpI family protein [Caloranaerobacter azorensis]|nr:AtpZ/AtpI family protein [Caloranaerobacter azorensis]